MASNGRQFEGQAFAFDHLMNRYSYFYSYMTVIHLLGGSLKLNEAEWRINASVN